MQQTHKSQFSGGGGSGAIVTSITGSGIITSLVITNAGSGYINTPTITISQELLVQLQL